jgi:predicted component of type VI protein secretion system
MLPDIKSGQGELAHRALKAFYPLTSKLDTPAQLAKHERRRRFLRRVEEAGGTFFSGSQSRVDAPPSTLFEEHHHIATNRNNPIQLFRFLRENEGDPAVKVEAKSYFECFTHSGC